MTFEELNQLRNLKKEIEEQQIRLQELREDAVTISANIGDMPKSSDVADKLGNIVTEIAVLEGQINKDLIERLRKYAELEKYISDISDSLTRRIFRMRFIDALPWHKIARKCDGNYTADSVRMIALRFLQKH